MKNSIKDKERGFEKVKRIIEQDEKINKDKSNEDLHIVSLLPRRSTKNSAGYDFFVNDEDIRIPSIWRQFFDITIDPREKKLEPTLIKTGIKSYMMEDEVLYLYNRSSNPKKLGLILANSVGVIDSDYYNNSDNEGEIAFAFYNIFPFDIILHRGDKLGQGVFSKFLKADEDNANEIRKGGFGSTGE